MTVLVFVVYVSVGNSEHKNLHELKTVHYFSITEIIQCSTVVELSRFFLFCLERHCVFHICFETHGLFSFHWIVSLYI